ncbi:hypothetical protein C8F01DRAFT_1075427 [Mycena amicta]|nr:hypothetical protein C8F01DRAFT_1075427 [Mycena amicta]
MNLVIWNSERQSINKNWCNTSTEYYRTPFNAGEQTADRTLNIWAFKLEVIVVGACNWQQVQDMHNQERSLEHKAKSASGDFRIARGIGLTHPRRELGCVGWQGHGRTQPHTRAGTHEVRGNGFGFWIDLRRDLGRFSKRGHRSGDFQIVHSGDTGAVTELRSRIGIVNDSACINRSQSEGLRVVTQLVMESRSVVGVRRTLSEGPVGSRSVGRVAIDGIGGGDRFGRAETAVYVVSHVLDREPGESRSRGDDGGSQEAIKLALLPVTCHKKTRHPPQAKGGAPHFAILMRSYGGNSARQYGILGGEIPLPSPRHLRRSSNPYLIFENVARVKRLMKSVGYTGPLAVAGDCTKVRKRLTFSNDFGGHILGSIWDLDRCTAEDPEDIERVILEITDAKAEATQVRAILIKHLFELARRACIACLELKREEHPERRERTEREDEGEKKKGKRGQRRSEGGSQLGTSH